VSCVLRPASGVCLRMDSPTLRRTTQDAGRWTPLIFLLFILMGLRFVAPSVTVGDSGEFATAASTLSIAHPPGFPLYALAGKAVGTLLPLGGWAFRTNLFSLLCSAAALALFFDLAVVAGLGALPAGFAAALLAASPILLYNSFVTEVFALNLLAGVAALRLLVDPLLPPARVAAAGGLLLGLAAGSHQTIVLILPAALLALWLRTASAPRFARVLAWSAAGFALGFSVYLFLPIRSAHGPPLDWGHPADWQSAWHVILRKDYGSLALTVDAPLARTPGNAALQAGRWLVALWAQWGPAAALSVFGAFVWTGTGLGLPVLLVFAFFTGPFFLLLGNPPMNAELEGALPRFYLLSLLPLALLAGAGFRWLLTRSRAALLLLSLPVMLLAYGRPSWDARWDLLAYDYGRSVLRSLSPGSALFMDGGDDTFYTLAFLHLAEGRRGDAELHDRGGLIYRNAYGPDFRRLNHDEKEVRRRLIEAQFAATRPLFYSTMNPGILPGYALAPVGLVQQARAPDAHGRALPPLWPFYVLRAEDRLTRAHYRYRALAPFPFFMKGLGALESRDPASAGLNMGEALLRGADALWVKGNVAYALGFGAWRAGVEGDWARAERLYAWENRLVPEDIPGWMNHGVALEKLGRLEQAEILERRAVALDPRHADAWYALGALYWKKQEWKSAAEAFAQVVALRADPAAAEYLRRAREKAGP